MGIFNKLFSSKPKVDFQQLRKEGAVIIDVRTENEFKSGHIEGSKNIPLPDLQKHISKMDKKKTIITCCASGIRSGSAKKLLQTHGFTAHNGGAWRSLDKKIG